MPSVTIRQGYTTAQQLYSEVRDQGYSGSYKTVVRWLQAQGLLLYHSTEQELNEPMALLTQAEVVQTALSEIEPLSPPLEAQMQVVLSEPLWSARALSWLLIKDPTSLKTKEQQMLTFIRQEPVVETIYPAFPAVFWLAQAEHLEAWLKMCAACGIAEIEAFAESE